MEDCRQKKTRKAWAHCNHSRGRAGHYIDPRRWTIATEAVLYHN